MVIAFNWLLLIFYENEQFRLRWDKDEVRMGK